MGNEEGRSLATRIVWEGAAPLRRQAGNQKRQRSQTSPVTNHRGVRWLLGFLQEAVSPISRTPKKQKHEKSCGLNSVISAIHTIDDCLGSDNTNSFLTFCGLEAITAKGI